MASYRHIIWIKHIFMIDYMHHNNLSGAFLRLRCIKPEMQQQVKDFRIDQNVLIVSEVKLTLHCFQ